MGDFLYNLTQWLYTTPLNGFAQSMSETAFSNLIVTHFWAIPVFQVIHILAISASLSAVLMLNLRVYGLAGHATLAETAQRYTRVLWWSLVFIVMSGVLMLFGDTVRNLLNSIFWIKMTLVVIGTLSAVGFARRLKKQSASGVDVASGGIKTTAIFLIILWCVIILAGRWIAYAPS